jgi:ketosteroid isomerase-like protein
MKSRLANSIRCSFLYMNLGRRILASTLLGVIVTAAAGAQSAPAVSPAEARTAIQAGYAEWAKARVALDMNTIERMLAPDFYFQLPDRKLTRQEFIDRVHSAKTIRFDASVLTVEPRGNDWEVLISAKIEVETKEKDGKTSKGYTMLVARDDWRKLNDNQWTLLASEPLGQQRWKDERPSVANW